VFYISSIMDTQKPLIQRPAFLKQVADGLHSSPIVAILGPRQCGKTTLARQFLAEAAEATYFDLENPQDEVRLENPLLALSGLKGLVVIDEIQLMPALFGILRVLADRPDCPARFLILGSASPELVKNASESLAGRVRFVDLGGFDTSEVGTEHWKTLWLRGGFPSSFLAASNEESLLWRSDFIRTFLNRDLPQLGITIPSQQLRRFWTMVAHYHGQTWNASEIGRSLGVSYKTAQSYLDILCGGFMVRQLQPWIENMGKRIRKAPKIYLRDSGIFHSLLGIRTSEELQSHPKLGASWEGFALEHVLRLLGVRDEDAFCWATHAGAELDLLLFRGGGRYGIEFKYADAPRLTKSMRAAAEDLSLKKLYVLYPGEVNYPLAEGIEVVGLPNLETSGLYKDFG